MAQFSNFEGMLPVILVLYVVRLIISYTRRRKDWDCNPYPLHLHAK